MKNETTNACEVLKQIVASGYPVATFAKSIGRDATTLYKWLDGTRNISQKVENEVIKKLREMKNMWDNIII